MSGISSHLHFARYLIGTNLRASVALRGAFLLQAVFMIFNNLIYFSIWWIFFLRFDSMNGWKVHDLAALYGLTAFSIGGMLVFFGGAWNIARMVTDGELDSRMTQPKSLLLQVVGSGSKASGWGDMASGAGLLIFSGWLSWETLPLVLVLACSSVAIFLASSIIFQSMAFWLGPVETLARQLSEFVITFSIYPQSIYPMYLRAILFTLIPAGFVSYLPVLVLREFSWLQLGAILAAAVAYGALAVFVFYRGLRRYESGNRFGGIV